MQFSWQRPLVGDTIGIVFGTYAPMHQGHLDVIMRAKKENDGGCMCIVCGKEKDRGGLELPHKRRYRYVRELFADDDLVAIYGISETELKIPPYISSKENGWKEWLCEFERIWKLSKTVACRERIWYVGEESYYEDLTALGEKVVLLDRAENPITATMIRDNPIQNWDKIARPFKRAFSTNILVTGTASEGKTTMVQDLGKYFNAPVSYEYAREYIRENGLTEWELDSSDYLAFLQGQYSLNKRLINSQENHGVFFADTDSMTTRMYAKYYAMTDPDLLSAEDLRIIELAADNITKRSKWDKIFLLEPYGKFIDDGERNMDHAGMEERWELFEVLCQNIKGMGLWDKVEILNQGYYKNFTRIVEFVKDKGLTK